MHQVIPMKFFIDGYFQYSLKISSWCLENTLPVIFVFLEKFLGDQKASYNQELKFKLRVGQAGVVPRPDDLIIMAGGARVTKISVSLTDQNNPLPDLTVI